MAEEKAQAHFVAGVIAAPFAVAGLYAIGFVLTLWQGFVLSVLWVWFAPALTAVRLPLPEAVGVLLVVRIIRWVH